MAPLATASRLCLRSAAAKPAVRALSSSAVRQADAPGAASYTSPFKGESKGSKIPDFSKYMSKGNETTNKLFSYFAVGTMGAITAAGAKSTVQGGLIACLCGGGGGNGLKMGIGALDELELADTMPLELEGFGIEQLGCFRARS